jgi:Ca-activated chloride channel family protein
MPGQSARDTSPFAGPFKSSDGEIEIEILSLRKSLLAGSPVDNFLLLILRSLMKGGELSRLTVNLGIIIDKSHSMLGPPFMQAAEGAIALMRNLSTRDRMSVLLFDEAVDVVLEGASPDKMPDAANVLRNALVAGGNTNISLALEKGAAILGKTRKARDVSKLILLTDGNPNRGITEENDLIKLVTDIRSEGISLSAIGLGLDYNEELLVKMTDAGGGYYYHSSRPRDIKKLFQRELGIVKNIHLRGLELAIKPKTDFRIGEIFHYDSRNMAGEHILSLPDMERAQELEILLNLNALPHPHGIFKALDIGVKYRSEGSEGRSELNGYALEEFTSDSAKLKESNEKRVDRALTMKNVQSHLIGTIQGIKTRTLSREEAFKQLKDYQKTLVMSGRTIEAMEIQEAIHSFGKGEEEEATKKLAQSAQRLKRLGPGSKAPEGSENDK